MPPKINPNEIQWDAPAAIDPGQVQWDAAPARQPMTDREAWESSLPVRALRGIEGPAITLLKMVGPDSIKQQLAEIDQLRESGMKKRGNEGFDWAGLAGSMVPSTAIAKGVSAAVPAVTALGKIRQGALTGAATSAAQPLPGGQDELSMEKVKQILMGGGLGGAVSAVGQGVKSFFGSNKLNPEKLKTYQEGTAKGYAVPPSMVNPSGLNNTLESIAGKAAVIQDAGARNQRLTTAIAPEDIGLRRGADLSEAVLDRVREKAGESFRKLNDINPGGELRRLQVRSKVAQAMEPGPVTGLRVTQSQPMEPGPVTGMKVIERTGDPATTGLRVGEVRDAEGRLIGLKIGKKSEGVEGALEGIKAKVTSRGQDVPGALEGMKGTVVSRGQDVKGPLEGMKMSVRETRGGHPLEDLKDFRNEANAYYKEHFHQGTAESLRKAKEFTAKAKEIEHEFERRAAAMGRSDLVQAMKDDRTLIAKTYDIEKALTPGTGNVSAPTLAAKFDKTGEKGMSGNLLTVAKMAQAFPSVMREGDKIPVAGVSGTDAVTSALLGGIGLGTSGPLGATAAALPWVVRPAARNLVLSPFYQKHLAQGIPARYLPLIDAMTQQAAGAAGTTAGRNY